VPWLLVQVLNTQSRMRGLLEYGQKAMFTSRGPISLDPDNLIGCKWVWGRGGERDGIIIIIHHTAIAFNMADYVLVRELLKHFVTVRTQSQSPEAP
jgi:hypothetical protein